MTSIRILAFLLVVSVGWPQGLSAQHTASSTPRLSQSFSDHVEVRYPSCPLQAPWQRLDRLTNEDRANSLLSVDLCPEAPAEAHHLARRIEDAWKNGEYATAIAKTQDLGSLVGPSDVELGFLWKQPRITTQTNILASNVRIGDVDSAQSISLATNLDASRVFCVISRIGGGHAGSWDLYLSTDKGITWANTYTQSGTGNAPKTALIPTPTSLYVGYLPYFTLQHLRLKKFQMSDGSQTTLAGGVAYYDILKLTGTESFGEIAATSAPEQPGGMLSIVASTNTRTLHYFQATTSHDTSWYEYPDDDAVAVSKGLSTAIGVGVSNIHGYISYADTNGNVCVDTISMWGNHFERAWTRPYANGITSLSAYGDTVICAYDNNSGTTQHVRYLINYDGGGVIWRDGAFQDTLLTSNCGVPMIEQGQGMGVIYRHDTGTEWVGRFVYRPYPRGNSWSLPVEITDYAPHASRPAIVALGEQTWGVAYVVKDDIPATGAVAFASFQLGATDVEQQPETTPAFIELMQNYPNPFNPTTTLRYTIAGVVALSGAFSSGVEGPAVSDQQSAVSNVKLAVYDLLGREVAVLVDEQKQPGEYTTTWDAREMPSGVYFYRLMVGGACETKKMLLLR